MFWNCISAEKVKYVIEVKTGDKMFSGTDSNVFIKLHCKNGESCKEKLLDCMFRNDLETGGIDIFKLKRQKNLPSIDFIQIWRDNSGILDNWYVDYIKVTKVSAAREHFVFPVFRWIKAGVIYHIWHLDTNLPQTDPFANQRKLELEDKRHKYELEPHFEGAPSQVR